MDVDCGDEVAVVVAVGDDVAEAPMRQPPDSNAREVDAAK